MMIHEFEERTKYHPGIEEYHYIEESYYEFDGNKDEFCKQWIKDKKSGKWDMEYKFRKALDDQKAEFEKQLAEKEDTLEFYRPYFDKARQAEKKIEEMQRKIDRVKHILETY